MGQVRMYLADEKELAQGKVRMDGREMAAFQRNHGPLKFRQEYQPSPSTPARRDFRRRMAERMEVGHGSQRR